MIRSALVLPLLGSLLLAACGDARAPSQPSPVQSEEPRADQWLGRWTGPEGTALTLTQEGGGYRVHIESLDGAGSYLGVAVDDHLSFQRDGATETLRATDGVGTGMKWLADKSDCLVIRPSEGFCREGGRGAHHESRLR